MANSSKFRGDQIGSLLRPQRLLEARRRLEAGMIDADELRLVENEEIAEAVKRQKACTDRHPHRRRIPSPRLPRGLCRRGRGR